MTRLHDHVPGGCRDLLAELFDYLDETLSPARCRALERHLANCPCCGELALNLRKAIALCQLEGRTQLPATVKARARQRVAALLGEPTRPRAAKRPATAASAASTKRGGQRKAGRP